MASWIAYRIMKGVMRPWVSAGSNQVGASEMCTPHVSWPSGAAAAGAATANTTRRTHATTPRCRIRYLSSGIELFPTAAGEAQQHQEEVDEVEIEGQRADHGVGPHLSLRQGQRHLLESLCVPRGEAGEDDDTDDRDQELQRVVVPEHADERSQDEADQAHHEELPGTGQASLRRRAEERERPEHTGG